MSFKEHICFNYLFLILILFFFKNYFLNINWLYILISSFLFCLLPDLDHKNSFLSKKFFLINYIINFFFKHRYFTHSLLCIILLFFFIINLDLIISYKLNINIVKGMIIGYLNHILMDMNTYNGVVFFWPFNFRVKIFFSLFLKIFLTNLFFFYFINNFYKYFLC